MSNRKAAANAAAVFLFALSLVAVLPADAQAAVDLGNVTIAQSGWRYNLTIMREQAKTIPAKADQYQYYLNKNHITDEYVVAYAAAVAAKFGSGTAAAPPSTSNNFTPDPILNGIEIRNEGWRYNLTIMREQAKTVPSKAAQYQGYLAQFKVTDAYIAAYAAAVAAKFPADSGGGGGSGGGGSTFTPDPILNGIEIRNTGWRYNLTVLKKQGQFSADKQATYIYYRDRNHVTDAYVDAYAAAVAALFNPDDVGKDITVTKKSGFTIYRGFRYVGLPSLANCGLSEDIRILYPEELFATSNRDQPDLDRLKTRVIPNLLKRNVTYVVIDIEQWDAVAEMDKLITVIRTLKEGVRAAGNTKMKFGFYMLVPERNFLAPVTRGDRPDRYTDWLATNETMRRLAAEVDVVFPSLYTSSENRDDWLTFARANIEQARKYGKKVIPAIWPQYHNTAPGIGTSYMPIKFWEMQLKELYNISDSLIIWGSVAYRSTGWDNWDKTREWWGSTRSFAKAYSNVSQTGTCDD